MNINSIRNIDDFDWRLEKVVPIKDIKAGIFSVGSGGYITLAGGFKIGNEEISFEIPNMSAVFLDYANKLYQQSYQYSNIKNFPRINKIRTVNDYDKFIEILQARMGSIIFSFLALETFMNDSIPEGYIWKGKNKEDIQGRVGMEKKFKDIMVEIFCKGKIDDNFLEKFEELKNLRDRLTHLKNEDKSSGDSTKDTIWKPLLVSKFPNYAISVKDIIGYFIEDLNEEEKPRWFKKVGF